MKGAKRFRARLARARLALGGCRELRRRAREEFAFFTAAEESRDGPYFGSWL
ncbi:hypothetical protein [Glycomyces terrestris]|uniref:hypothetical protein n=1 Tax=Glycomyces terrestris TaxID=2493553 RepID=UPI0013155265|nr:hypothetical protein [Glycomyces terrestris]